MIGVSKIGGTLAILSLAFFTGFSMWQSESLNKAVSNPLPVKEIPMTIGEWTGRETAGLDIRSQEILQLSTFVKRTYTNPAGETVLLYIGYWDRQTGDYQAAKHSPALCLPSNGWGVQPLGRETIPLASEHSSSSITAKKLVGTIQGNSFLFHYWFFAGEKKYVEEWQALFNISMQNIFTGRSDGGIVEVSAAIPRDLSKKDAIAKAESAAHHFIAALAPELEKLSGTPPDPK